MAENKKELIAVYRVLRNSRGFLNWWPASGRFEVMVGAILTQNTAWSNVEKAISNLRRAKLLSYKGLKAVAVSRLAGLIRSSGYYNQKAIKLKNLIFFLEKEYGGSIKRMGLEPLATLRKKLLNVNGIGPETADSMLLYALNKKIFVVDAYTLRVFNRLGLINADWQYNDIQAFFMNNLKGDIRIFNDFHAQIVMHAKEICKKRPLCSSCVLTKMCKYASGQL